MKYKKSLFIFRRDLRLEDNTGLILACKQSEKVIPCFIFDKDQVGKENSYRSMNAIQFMIESLQNLEAQLKLKKGKLFLFYGHTQDIVKKLLSHEKIEAIFVNKDYTPFALKRDESIKKLCAQHHIDFIQSPDILLNEPETIQTGSGTPYSIFTAFYKRSIQEPVAKPHKLPNHSFATSAITHATSSLIYKKILSTQNKHIQIHGGTRNALKLLSKIKALAHYAKTRDVPSQPTSYLSAHLKFGTISVRQAYYAIKEKLGATHPLLRQLYWRDFFTHVAYHSPFIFGHPYHAKYKKLPWKHDTKGFKAWCEGKTGFPIVDAGMRQLNATGWMHNRVRMIVASFLTKDLHINWLEGEKYFAQQLIDYDPAVNNGNWQWSASTGCDAQPYFRIFNPWIQQKKFDPQCAYIKTWIPELKNVDLKIIHSWFKSKVSLKEYPKPILDHGIESKKAKSLYRSATK